MDALLVAAYVAGGLSGAAAYAIATHQKPATQTEIFQYLSQVKPLLTATYNIDVSEERDNTEFVVSGTSIFILNPQTPDVPVYIRFNEPETNQTLDLTQHRTVKAPFYRFFITNAVGTGVLTIIINKVDTAGLEPAQLNINIVAQEIGAIQVDITAQTIGQLDINILAQSIDININLVSSGIMLPVDIQAQYVTVEVDLTKVGGTTQTGADWTTYLAHLAKHAYATPANSGVDVTTASTLIKAANASRLYLAIVNDSDTTVYLGIGAAAVANQGIRINANGGSYEINWTNLYTGAIYGIHDGAGNKRVTVMEGD